MVRNRDESERISSVLRAQLEAEPAVVLAVLYGSVLRGKLHARSDVDLALAGAAVLETGYLSDLSAQLSAACGREIQLRDLRRLEGLILHRVLTTGRAIKKVDTTLYAELAIKALDFEADLLPALGQSQEEQVRRFVEDC